MCQGDREGRPIRINLRPSPSPSVGAGVDEDVGLGRLRRPRPVHLASMLGEHDHLPTPRATLKALPPPHRPPSPLRTFGLLPDFPASVNCTYPLAQPIERSVDW